MPVFLGLTARTKVSVSAEVQATMGVTEGVQDQTLQESLNDFQPKNHQR